MIHDLNLGQKFREIKIDPLYRTQKTCVVRNNINENMTLKDCFRLHDIIKYNNYV